jgi:multidrug transporter EmrE-like cation transporter
MIYLYLTLAIVFEAGWAIAMKLSDGFSKVGPAAATVVMYLASVVFLGLASKRMDLGVAYAIWAGTGVVLIAAAGIVYFKEPITALKAVSMLLVVAGIVGLGLGGAGH